MQNQTVATGDDECITTSQILYIAGSGTTFTVENGGSATLAAGWKVILQEGTTVQLGGYLHAYITYINDFCNPTSPVANTPVTPGPEIITAVTGVDSDDFAMRVYPNPTDGKFILELPLTDPNSVVVAEIYGMNGKKIIKENLSGSTVYRFSLENQPNGIYFIRVIAGEESGIVKIMK
jgi:hypothetical protein